MHCDGEIKLRSHYTSCCLIEVVTKETLTVDEILLRLVLNINQSITSECFRVEDNSTCTIISTENNHYYLELYLQIKRFLSTQTPGLGGTNIN